MDRTRISAARSAEIDKLGGGLSASATEDYVATDSKIRVSTAMAWSTSALALVLGGIGVLNTMIVSVFERTSEIGVLRAIGWRKFRIIRMILLESGLLSIAGATLGTFLALLMTYGSEPHAGRQFAGWRRSGAARDCPGVCDCHFDWVDGGDRSGHPCRSIDAERRPA